MVGLSIPSQQQIREGGLLRRLSLPASNSSYIQIIMHPTHYCIQITCVQHFFSCIYPSSQFWVKCIQHRNCPIGFISEFTFGEVIVTVADDLQLGLLFKCTLKQHLLYCQWIFQEIRHSLLHCWSLFPSDYRPIASDSRASVLGQIEKTLIASKQAVHLGAALETLLSGIHVHQLHLHAVPDFAILVLTSSKVRENPGTSLSLIGNLRSEGF